MRARGRQMTEDRTSSARMSLCLLALAGPFLFGGCSNSAGEFGYTKLSHPYYQTRLGNSSSLDVLAQAHLACGEIARAIEIEEEALALLPPPEAGAPAPPLRREIEARLEALREQLR